VFRAATIAATDVLSQLGDLGDLGDLGVLGVKAVSDHTKIDSA
jgi:hypothetical protein